MRSLLPTRLSRIRSLIRRKVLFLKLIVKRLTIMLVENFQTRSSGQRFLVCIESLSWKSIMLDYHF